MKRVHIIGRKNHGKTTLVVELTAYLTQQGYRVGAIKHTHHSHDLDTPGKDSHRHGEAGACVVGILSRGMSAVFWKPDADIGACGDDRYEQFAPHFAACDLVIVEGDTLASAPKIEVWRREAGSSPMAVEGGTISAVVSDDPVSVDAPVWQRSDLPTIAENVLKLLSISP